MSRDQEYRRKARMSRVREYYYGPAGDLRPHSLVIKFSDVTIFRVGGASAAPLSALPIGQAPQYDQMKATEMAPSGELTHSLLAVMHCTDPANILQTNVAGLLYVTSVEPEKSQMTVLSPCPGSLPSRYLVSGSIKWIE